MHDTSRRPRLSAALKALTCLGILILAETLIEFALVGLVAPMPRHPVITPQMIVRADLPLLASTLIAGALTMPRGVAARLLARREWDALKPALKATMRRALAGIVAGAAAIGLLTVALAGLGALDIGRAPPHPLAILLYVPAFLIVASAEELMFRGPILFWLGRAIGFYPALALSSAIFGLLHGLGADPAWGAVSAGVIGLFFGLTLRVTGSLWFAIGFHAAWDYGLSAVLGCRDSGIESAGALFNSIGRGPVWLSGGDAGPEGSVLCFVLMALLCAAACTMLWRQRGKTSQSTP